MARNEKNLKVIIIDDDKDICNILQYYLEKYGYNVIFFNNGEDAIDKFMDINSDIILLDIMLPIIENGWHVCREIRKKSNIPIIIITKKNEIIDKVICFELGADDYIVKPFDIKEVIARINAVIRRVSKINFEVCYDKISINITRYELKVNNKNIDTPPKELELLYYLASNPNIVYTRNQILGEVWGFDYYGDSRTIDVHINRLREKLDGISNKWTLKTVWGVGYKFEVQE